MRVERYQPQLHRDLWNAFVAQSRNATFLFQRDYMDYHADRFLDHSLLLWQKERLIALLPANQQQDQLLSHGGLTYGGLLLGSDAGAATVLEAMEAVLLYLSTQGIRHLLYKTIPHCYHQQPCEEDRYALFRLGAVCSRVDASAVVALPRQLPMQERRRRGARRASKAGLRVVASCDWDAFWPILEANLREKHQVIPVHAVQEIRRLAAAFPENIRLYVVRNEQEILAGTVIYETDRVAHAQYIASTDAGRDLGALDLLFTHLIDEHYPECKAWFDFGISTEAGGKVLNDGLAGFKEGFGARTMVYVQYSLDVASWTKQ